MPTWEHYHRMSQVESRGWDELSPALKQVPKTELPNPGAVFVIHFPTTATTSSKSTSSFKRGTISLWGKARLGQQRWNSSLSHICRRREGDLVTERCTSQCHQDYTIGMTDPAESRGFYGPSRENSICRYWCHLGKVTEVSWKELSQEDTVALCLSLVSSAVRKHHDQR